MPQRQCRFCLESEESLTNPLISPCPCRGSVQYVHRICLYRWLTTSPDTTTCSICKTPFPEAYLPRLEIIPEKDATNFFLSTPLVALFAVQYAVGVGINTTLAQEDFLYNYMVSLHVVNNLGYAILFFMTARVRNWREYIHVASIPYACCAIWHLLVIYLMWDNAVLLLMTIGCSLNIYWQTHLKALADINALGWHHG